MKEIKYMVVERNDIHKVLVGKNCERYVKFDTNGQAEVYKTGLEAIHKNNAYCIVQEIPMHYKQISVFTGEKENTYDYT